MKATPKKAFGAVLTMLVCWLAVALWGGVADATALSPAPGDHDAILERVLDAQLRAILAERGVTGDPSIGRALPDIDDPVAQLGKKLFFTKALGGDMDAACASCHWPTLGGGDGLALSIGVGALDPDLIGPGRMHPSGGPTVPRNAPTTFNVAMYDECLFHDGRVESMGKAVAKNGADGLGIRTPDAPPGVPDAAAGANMTAAQSRFPVTSEDEMRGFVFEAGGDNVAVREHLAARLGGYGAGAGELIVNGWLQEFQAAFDSQAPAEELITYDAIAQAIGDYENSQVFVDTPWRAYVQGDRAAIDLSAKRGALLFYLLPEQGGANCVACHAGDFFTDEKFHVLAVPQIGPGKGDGPAGDDDFGRFRETQDPRDLYAFRTPTLLNVEVFGPYGHDGAYDTLEDIIRHHLDPATAARSFAYGQLDPYTQLENAEANTARAIAQYESLKAAGLSKVQEVSLSDVQVQDLVSFVLALTDPCVKDAACLAPWMPSEEEADPDGLQLRFGLNTSSP